MMFEVVCFSRSKQLVYRYAIDVMVVFAAGAAADFCLMEEVVHCLNAAVACNPRWV